MYYWVFKEGLKKVRVEAALAAMNLARVINQCTGPLHRPTIEITRHNGFFLKMFHTATLSKPTGDQRRNLETWINHKYKLQFVYGIKHGKTLVKSW